jgi:hypothetical protein
MPARVARAMALLMAGLHIFSGGWLPYYGRSARVGGAFLGLVAAPFGPDRFHLSIGSSLGAAARLGSISGVAGGKAGVMLSLVRRLALPIAVTSLIVNVVVLIVSLVLWWMAIVKGWLDEVTFVSNVSMLALVFAGVSGVAAGLAGILALVPTDDIVDKITGDDD